MNPALQKFRQKYPGYDDLSDQELASKLVAKYPEYQDLLGDVAATPVGVGTLPVASAPFHQQAQAQMLGENPGSAAFLAGTATLARIFPGMAAQALAPGRGGKVASQMGLSGAGEALGEAIEAPVTGEGLSGLEIAKATAVPGILRGVGRAVSAIPVVGEAIKRTGQRLIPSRFTAAQEEAQAAVKGAIGEFADEGAGAGAKFAASRQAAAQGATLQASPLKTMADEVGSQSIAEDKPVQELLKIVRDRVQPDGSISLRDLEQLRRYLGKQRGAGTAKEVKAIQQGLYETLEQAAQSNPGAADLQEALRLFKMGRGAEKLEALVERAHSGFPTGGPGTGPALNVQTLIKLVNRDREDLTKLLGPAGMAKWDALLQEMRTLPPKTARTWANIGVQSIASGLTAGLGTLVGLPLGPVGAAVGGIAGAVAGVGLKELGQNWVSVSKTPDTIKQLLNLTALGANALRGGSRLTADDREP